MLSAAQRERRAGRDILIGVVETHGRAETAALLDGLDPTELGVAIEGRYGAISDPFETRILRNLLSIDTSESATQMIGGDGDDVLNGGTGADSLAGAAALQAAWGMGVWSRALSDSWDMGEALLKLQAKALSPIHAAAVANARRLKT